MAWAIANGGANTAHAASSASTSTLTVPATTTGNVGILAASYDHNDAATFAPTGGGTWARIGTNQNSSGDGQDATWFWVVFTGSVTSITLNGGSVLRACGVTYVEFVPPAGTVSIDAQDTTKAFASFPSPAGTVMTSNSISAASASELLVSAIYHQAGSAPTFTQGAGFALAVAEPGINGATGASAIEWKESASGSQAATWTANQTSGNYTIQIAALLPSSGGGPAPQQLRPDADTDADSWTPTPLYSKLIDAGEASGTIQATSS